MSQVTEPDQTSQPLPEHGKFLKGIGGDLVVSEVSSMPIPSRNVQEELAVLKLVRCQCTQIKMEDKS